MIFICCRIVDGFLIVSYTRSISGWRGINSSNAVYRVLLKDVSALADRLLNRCLSFSFKPISQMGSRL